MRTAKCYKDGILMENPWPWFLYWGNQPWDDWWVASGTLLLHWIKSRAATQPCGVKACPSLKNVIKKEYREYSGYSVFCKLYVCPFSVALLLQRKRHTVRPKKYTPYSHKRQAGAKKKKKNFLFTVCKLLRTVSLSCVDDVTSCGCLKFKTPLGTQSHSYE